MSVVLEKRSAALCRGPGVGLLVCSLLFLGGCSNDAAPPRAGDAAAGDGTVPDPDAGVSADAGDPRDASGDPDAGPADTGIVDQCDPLLQSGCVDPSTKCIIERGGAECVTPNVDDVAINEPCAGGQCQPGMVCIGDGSGLPPVCRQICDRESGAGCAGLPFEADCLERVRNTNWGVCSPLPPACDVLTQEPCPIGESCQPFLRFGGSFDLRCRPSGPGLEEDSCSTERCERGLVCINIGGAPLCKKVCDDDPGCAPDGMCAGRVNGVAVKYCTR